MANWVENLSDEQVDNLLKIRDAATRHGVDPKLAVALAMRESGLRNIKGAVDEHGKFAYGPMQLREAAATDMKVDRFNVDQNIDAGVRYLKQHLDTFKDQNKALHAYHLGANHGTIKSGQVPADIGKYISDIHNYIKEATPEATQAKGGKEVPPLPVAERDVEIADVDPVADWKIAPQQPQPNGASATDAIVSGSLGSLVGSVVAPSEHRQMERIRNEATRLAEANAPIEEYNKRQLEKYNEAQELRNKAMKAFDEKNNPAGVPKYVESQVKGPSTNIIHYDPNVITNQQVQEALPGLAESHVKARQIEPQFVIDPNRGGLSVPSQHTAPPPPKTEDIFPPIEKPTLRPLKQANTPPLQSGARIGAAPGFFGGVNAADAYTAVQKQDPVGAALGSAGAVAGGLATKVANPRVNIPLTLFSATMAGAQRLRHKFQDQPATESVLNKAEGGLARLPKFAGRGEQLVKAAVKKGEELIGREPPKLFVPRSTRVMPMSEALGQHEGKYLGLTQSDNFGVHGGRMGGNQFPNFQNISPTHQKAGVVWMNDTEPHANALVNNRRFNNKDVVYSTYIGGPDQLKSNKTVTNDILNAHYNRNLTPEQIELINNRIATVKDSKGRLIFPQPFDIRDRFATQELGTDTFARRGALASMLGAGEGVNKTRGGIALPNYEEILRSHRDPLTEGVPTSSVGTRLFTVEGRPAQYSEEFHPDYRWAVFGQDQGVQFAPVPQRLAVPDWHSKYKEKYPNREPHGNAWFSYPNDPQFIDEAYLTRLQKEGYAQGGLTGYAGKGESLVRAGKAGLERFLAPSQEKGRMYHGTRADIQGFSPNVRGATYLSPDPKFANRFAAQTDDPKVGEAVGPNPKIVEGANVMPVHVQATNIYDPLNEKQSEAMRAHLLNKHKDIFEQQDVRRMMAESADKYENWRQMEHPLMQGGLKDLGHDAFYVNEAGVRNLGVYDPKRIKSAIGNQGTYDTSVNDLTKAEGGLVHLQSGGNPRMAALKALGKQFVPKVSAETKPGWAGIQEPVSVSLQTEKGLPFEMRRDWPGRYSFNVDGKDAGAINYVKSPIGEWKPNVMVNPEFQRQGIANSVYDFLEQNVIKEPFSSSGGQSEAGRAFREARAARNYKEGGPTGLYANIHAKQERIKHGSGEKMRKPGDPGAPTAEAFRESEKTAKLKEGGTPSLAVGRGEKLSTEQGAGLTAKGRAKYNRETGSHLKAPQPEGGPRKDSFCARMQGVVDHAKGDAPRAKASLKRWKC